MSDRSSPTPDRQTVEKDKKTPPRQPSETDAAIAKRAEDEAAERGDFA